jgi:hypothetical protein
MTTRAKEIRELGNTGYLEVDANGNVGIGTSNPLAPLHVNGNIVVGTGDANQKIYLEGAVDDLNMLHRSTSENATIMTARHAMALIIDSNNDDSDTGNGNFSIRRNGTTIAGSTSCLEVTPNGKVIIGRSDSVGSDAPIQTWTSQEVAAQFIGGNDTTVVIGGNLGTFNGSTRSGEQYIAYQNESTGANAWMAGFDDDEIYTIAYGALGEIQTADHKLRLTQSGNLDISGSSVIINKGTTDYTALNSGVVSDYFTIHTNYNAEGSQSITFSNLDGNWLDGTTGADSAFGWLWNFENYVRSGIAYDHRSTEEFQLWSAYGKIAFYTPNTPGNNGVPTDSNISRRLTIEPGGNVVIEGPALVLPKSTSDPSTTTTGAVYWNTSETSLKIHDGNSWTILASLRDGATAARALSGYSNISSEIGNSYTPGVYYINTPDGSVQQSYLMRAENYNWVLIGRFAADASQTIQNTLASQRSMVDVSQSGTSMWNADWGSSYIQDLMIWGATDFSAQSGHTVNWVYQVGGGTTLRAFLSGASSGDNTANSSAQITPYSGSHPSAKNGFYCPQGARDGVFKGSRWTNSGFRYFLMSDQPTNCYTNPYGLSNPISSCSYWDGADDAKLSVTYSGDTSGQDYGNISQIVGWDDGNRAFADFGATSSGQNNTTTSYSSALTLWIRM